MYLGLKIIWLNFTVVLQNCMKENYLKINDLKVSKKLLSFVNDELLKDLNINKPIWVTEAMMGKCRVIPTYVNAFANGAEVIIDVGANAPGMKMSKGARKKLNEFIKEVDGFKSINLVSKKKAEFVMKDGSTKMIEF